MSVFNSKLEPGEKISFFYESCFCNDAFGKLVVTNYKVIKNISSFYYLKKFWLLTTIYS